MIAAVPIRLDSLWFVVRGCCHELDRLAARAEETGNTEDLYWELVHLAELVRCLWAMGEPGLALHAAEHLS